MTALDIFALILVIILAWILEWIMVNTIFNGYRGRDGQNDLARHSRVKVNREPGFQLKAPNLIQEDQVERRKSGLPT